MGTRHTEENVGVRYKVIFQFSPIFTSICQNPLVLITKSILSSVKSRGGQKDEDRGGYPVVSN